MALFVDYDHSFDVMQIMSLRLPELYLDMLLHNHECKLGWTLITLLCYVIFYSCIIPRPNMLFAYGENLYQLPSKRLEPSRYASFINLHWHVISFYILKNLQIFYATICVVNIKIGKVQG